VKVVKCHNALNTFSYLALIHTVPFNKINRHLGATVVILVGQEVKISREDVTELVSTMLRNLTVGIGFFPRFVCAD